MPDKTPEQIVQEAFAELKATNDANLKQRDVVLENKLAKIDATLDKFEPLNQAVTLASAQQNPVDVTVHGNRTTDIQVNLNVRPTAPPGGGGPIVQGSGN